MSKIARRFVLRCALVLTTSTSTLALATSTYEYGANEYVTIEKGLSPDRKYAITAHGGSEAREERFHIYLTDAVTGKKIGPLEEIGEFLDTGADAYCAKWSKDSDQVTIIYRIDRHEPLKVYSYHIANRRASLIKGPTDATKEQAAYWAKQCGSDNPAPPEKVFGTPLKQ
ncbi:MAG: hypothetical protein ABJF10_20475 [Chthoniobacter sp.]|uniref:hypothetical protein n=1 Tax=Chthoniobacter sp. TaxID=2510640 RepID=UPI0032A1B4CC